jgi:hypothetical protein
LKVIQEASVKTGAMLMAMNGISAKMPTVHTHSRRPRVYISGLVVRILIAFVISWLIVFAFFATVAH